MSPPGTPTSDWEWRLDEAAIQEDGGADGLAVAVDLDVAAQYPYKPPSQGYERILWEASKLPSAASSPIHALTSAGWIQTQDGGPPPVFVAHTMLGAVWLLRQSLPSTAVADAAWIQLTQAACQLEIASPPRKLAAKRARGAADAESDSGAVESETAVNTVTNHNRRAEKARKTKAAKVAKRRQAALGLVGPSSQAPVVERNAHGSIAPQDEPTVAWIVKQPAGLDDFIHTAKLPYATANTMLRCARSIGDETAQMHAAHFVQNWRRSGHPLLLANARSDAVALSGTSEPTSSPSPFQLAMDAVTSSECVSATAGVVYRWGMAQLGQRYDREIALIQSQGGGGQARTQAKKAIWDQEQPRMSWAAYNARLKRSRRWFQAAQTLGWGFLVLIPAATVTPNWVEQTLRSAEWDIWLRLVERVNPEAVQASRDFDAWVGSSALENGSIQGAETLLLETRLPSSRIHEVADSDNDEEQGSESGSDSAEEAASERLLDSPAEGTRALRDLFRPAGGENLSS